MAELYTEVDRPYVSPDGAAVKLSVTIQPGMQRTDIDRQIALCVDTSGSMTGEKIEQVREGILWTFGYLEPDDYVSVVTFDDEVNVVLEATRWGDVDREDAEAAVEGIEASGGTDIMGGLKAAYEALTALPSDEDTARRILLLSDGRDNRPAEEFATVARRIRKGDDIAVPAAGIGDYYDEDVIRAVGTASEAEWMHLAEPADIEDFFGRKVEGISTIVAPQPHLEFSLADGVEVREILLRRPQVREANYERHGNTVRVYLPDLLEFEEQEVLLEARTPRWPAGREVTLAEAVLRAKGRGERASIVVGVTEDRRKLARTNEDVGLRHTDTKVRKAAGEGDIDAAETIIDRAARDHDEESLSGMQTVVEKAKEGDIEQQYMTTKVKDT